MSPIYVHGGHGWRISHAHCNVAKEGYIGDVDRYIAVILYTPTISVDEFIIQDNVVI